MFAEPLILHFYSILALLGVGALVSLFAIPLKAHRVANMVSHGAALFAGLIGTVFSLAVLSSHAILSASYSSPFSFLTYAFHVDGLSAWFILVISLAVVAASLYGYGYVSRERAIRPGVFGFFYTAFIASLYTVVVANNGIFFLIAWEAMSLASYFLIVHEHHEASNVRAGFLYLLMTHVGTAFLMFALMVVGHAAGSFDFDTIRQMEAWSPLVRHGALAAALIGLGIKAGIVPLHIWLPEAHPAAPSHVSALLSGVMLKIAIFMIIRFFFDLLGFPTTIWWGVIILVLGALSALLGVLYALSEHDLKRLLAYHSVENIGIILLGIGSAGIFVGYGEYAFAGVALTAALFHTLNHAIFKGLLFLGAGSVVQTTHTRNMERYGGLIRILPATAFLFLVGSLAISGLPPLNGFASEWLTFQTLLAGVTVSTLYMKALFVGAIGFLALTSGLAAACFVKAVGTTFLARPRAPLPDASTCKIREPLSMTLGMSLLALLTLFLGVFASSVVAYISSVLHGLGFHDALPQTLFAVGNDPSSQSSYAIAFPMMYVMLVVAVGVTYALVRVWSGERRETLARVWACGAPAESVAFAGPDERAEITATAFARTLMVVFRALAPTKEHVSTESVSGEATRVRFETHLVDVWKKYCYGPLERVTAFVARGARMLQSGNVNTYLLYMFVTLCALLLIAL
ncbi:MAG: hydrogenase 4 subunit B [Candidatus Pacebacteria bacterium]|nr:hydrogenase 4 subunit B [Candidatus Paceibacterota bacterium]